MICCVDSNIIVWGIKKQATIGQEENIVRAEKIFARADEYNDFILVPTIVLAEVLATEPPAVRIRYLEIFTKNFIVAPFDERAAMKYAEILFGRLDEVKAIAEASGTPRQKMKADHLIIATAIVNGASAIYSTDGGLKNFAAGLIDVRDLPPLIEPQEFKVTGQLPLWAEISDITHERKETDEDDQPF